MRRKHRIRPAPFDLLEGRVVLSHTMPAPPAGGAVHSLHRVLNQRDPSLADEVNQEFDSFRNDYDQARATYFTSIQNQSAPSPSTTYAFVVYTTQRVSLLAQQVLGDLSPAAHGSGHVPNPKRLVATAIMGPRAQIRPGSLASSLLQSIPQPGTTAPTASLYSSAQDYAIEAARAAILNGIGGS